MLMHVCSKLKVSVIYKNELTSIRAKMVALITNEGKVICFTSSAVQRYVVPLILMISSYIQNPKIRPGSCGNPETRSTDRNPTQKERGRP